jgi:hypothetical protein
MAGGARLTMIRRLNLEQVAHYLGRSYEWTRENWRTLQGFPRPYVGGGPHQQPLWTENAIEAYMLNPGQVDVETVKPAAPTPPADNDRGSARKRKLLTAAGA